MMTPKSKLSFRSCCNKQILVSFILLLNIIQVPFSNNALALSATNKNQYQLLMDERNVRIKQLKESKTKIFKMLLKEQARDKLSLKSKKLDFSQIKSQEEKINQYYQGLMKALDGASKQTETSIYSIWKKENKQYQNTRRRTTSIWQMIDKRLQDFESSFFSSATEKNNEVPKELILFAEHLKTCTPLTQQFIHPYTGDKLKKYIKGLKNGLCHYVEEIPGNFKMECFYPEKKRLEMTEFHLHPERMESVSIKSQSKFVDDKLVTKNQYFVDGKEVYHPLNDSLEKGECKIVSSGK